MQSATIASVDPILITAPNPDAEKRYEGIAMANKQARIACESGALTYNNAPETTQ
jgi:hypothetical protein